MTYSAMEIARYTVNYCNELKKPISNLKLQKMLYFMWIDYFKETGLELYADDICAWQLGPVIPDVYYEYCMFAGTPITVTARSEIEEKDKTILNRIIQKYLPISASVLVDKTHMQNKPWDIVFQGGLGNRDVIPFSLIKALE